MQSSRLCSLLAAAALTFAGATAAHATLQPGDNLAPYEIHNTANGEDYCQMCAFGTKPATVAAYGNLGDAAFWADLQKLQKIADANKGIGVFAQVLDSKDAKAIQAAAKQHGITFPVVYAKEADWDEVYKVGGVSRTVYLSSEFKVRYSNVGLDDKAVAAIQGKLKEANAAQQG